MNDEKTLRAINFDLDTNELKKFYGDNISKAYYDIKSFMKKNSFEHKQGSGYESTEKMNDKEVRYFRDKMYKSLPFLNDCTKKMYVTNVGETYDIMKPKKKRAKTKTINTKNKSEINLAEAIVDKKTKEKKKPFKPKAKVKTKDRGIERF